MGADKHEKHKHGRLPPFVPLLVSTLDSPAWRALSHGAKALYVCLRRRYSPNSHNNGRIYFSHRLARKELRSGYKQIARWYEELQFYGFIVMVTPGHLGVGGQGTAPRWRLTELGYMREAPTGDFKNWNGELFGKPRPVPPRPKTKSRDGKPLRTGMEIHSARVMENHNGGSAERYGNPSQAQEDSATESYSRTRLPPVATSARPLNPSTPRVEIASEFLKAIECKDARAKRAPQGAVASERVPSDRREQNFPAIRARRGTR